MKATYKAQQPLHLKFYTAFASAPLCKKLLLAPAELGKSIHTPLKPCSYPTGKAAKAYRNTILKCFANKKVASRGCTQSR
ncbi:hypothetical protein E2320_014461, partial [Naja naja]